jgi:TetR/AcrR family transcriptional regulator, transcriptional repressor of bet genes
LSDTSVTATRPRPGRPPTDARERILAAGMEVLKADGYAGLTIAKVAARAGANKALIAYHFGSKQGLVVAAGREVGKQITDEVVAAIGPVRSVGQVISGMVNGIWSIMDRDPRIARVYFDLTAVSVVEEPVRAVMREVRAGWRSVLVEMLSEADPELRPEQARSAALFIHAGLEGLVLERLEAGDTAELRRARVLFERAAVEAA